MEAMKPAATIFVMPVQAGMTKMTSRRIELIIAVDHSTALNEPVEWFKPFLYSTPYSSQAANISSAVLPPLARAIITAPARRAISRSA